MTVFSPSKTFATIRRCALIVFENERLWCVHVSKVAQARVGITRAVDGYLQEHGFTKNPRPISKEYLYIRNEAMKAVLSGRDMAKGQQGRLYAMKKRPPKRSAGQSSCKRFMSMPSLSPSFSKQKMLPKRPPDRSKSSRASKTQWVTLKMFVERCACASPQPAAQSTPRLVPWAGMRGVGPPRELVVFF